MEGAHYIDIYDGGPVHHIHRASPSEVCRFGLGRFELYFRRAHVFVCYCSACFCVIVFYPKTFCLGVFFSPERVGLGGDMLELRLPGGSVPPAALLLLLLLLLFFFGPPYLLAPSKANYSWGPFLTRANPILGTQRSFSRNGICERKR